MGQPGQWASSSPSQLAGVQGWVPICNQTPKTSCEAWLVLVSLHGNTGSLVTMWHLRFTFHHGELMGRAGRK